MLRRRDASLHAIRAIVRDRGADWVEHFEVGSGVHFARTWVELVQRFEGANLPVHFGKVFAVDDISNLGPRSEDAKFVVFGIIPEEVRSPPSAKSNPFFPHFWTTSFHA